jgi:hypothetical protein
MMHRRLFFTILAATVFVAALGGATDRASGAIRLTISDGTNQVVLEGALDADGRANFSTQIGEFDLVAQTTVVTEDTLVSTLSQAVQITPLDPSVVLPTLTLLAQVIDGSGNLAMFTLPDTAVVEVRSNASITGTTINSGAAQTTTYFNGMPVVSGLHTYPASPPTLATQLFLNPLGQYTLESELVISGVSGIGTGSVFGASSAVFGTDIPPEQVELIPEPGSMAVWGLGALGLAWAARRRLSLVAKG